MVMVNSGGPAMESESFESVQLRKLVRGFGLDWNDDDTHYSDNLIREGHPHFMIYRSFIMVPDVRFRFFRKPPIQRYC